MPSSRKKDFGLAVLVAALVAAGGLVPLYRHYRGAPATDQVATAPATAPAPGAPEPGAAAPAEPESAAPPAPAGTELVPAEEAESDRGPASASAAGPGMSFARAAGLHLKPDPMHLNSSVALVVDQDSGQTLASKNEEAVLPIASLTKLMTALLVTEANQPMDEMLTITQDDVDLERHSRSRLKPGTQLTRQEALRLALMSSENRAAHALGRAYPGGLPKLVETMNAKAHQLGMKNTTYVDPTGLSNRNQSTARDLSLLVAQAMKNPLMREYSTTPAHLANLNGRTLQYRNSNRLVRDQRGAWDIELQKTGYIVEAGRCLTMVTKVAGHNLIMVLLDADSNGTRLADAQRMRRWVVAQNGWQDHVVLAKAEAPRKAAAKKTQAKSKSRTAVAKAKAKSGKKTDVAKAQSSKDDKKDVAKAKSKGGKTAVAASEKKGTATKEGRVRQTFAAKHSAREKDGDKDGKG